MKHFFRLLASSPALAGILLHGYTAFVMHEGYSYLSWKIFLYSCFSYVICWTIAALINPLAGFFGALAALIDDMIVFHDVFIAPTHSTAPISLLFAPMANLILFVPVGLFIGWCVDRGGRAYRSRRPT
ncbi:hypothetical protein C5748_11460 [Phyllobacterium phragmitis]|uniref:Uncharacterized protein n=1 Tax=Phyllobacterium phragmitis TaxID=2670329 RepID=A0A2S9IS12_9HYPH|nr:hypothetical protein [Phyllobacterium phragmitis]PRD43324.1 hypothetical protein C5748_11460 [Phyllobacterium phragmitis]